MNTNHYLNAVITLVFVVPVILILPVFILEHIKIAQTAQAREAVSKPKVSLKVLEVEDRHNNEDELNREDVLEIAELLLMTLTSARVG